jgi:hypothetical protein
VCESSEGPAFPRLGFRLCRETKDLDIHLVPHSVWPGAADAGTQTGSRHWKTEFWLITGSQVLNRVPDGARVWCLVTADGSTWDVGKIQHHFPEAKKF